MVQFESLRKETNSAFGLEKIGRHICFQLNLKFRKMQKLQRTKLCYATAGKMTLNLRRQFISLRQCAFCFAASNPLNPISITLQLNSWRLDKRALWATGWRRGQFLHIALAQYARTGTVLTCLPKQAGEPEGSSSPDCRPHLPNIALRFRSVNVNVPCSALAFLGGSRGWPDKRRQKYPRGKSAQMRRECCVAATWIHGAREI